MWLALGEIVFEVDAETLGLLEGLTLAVGLLEVDAVIELLAVADPDAELVADPLTLPLIVLVEEAVELTVSVALIVRVCEALVVGLRLAVAVVEAVGVRLGSA